jgi:putative Holliday junction resolvase
MRRVLAVDYGRRRIGLAVSDPLGITAQGLDTLEVRSRNLAAAEVSRVAREREEVRAFAAELEERTGLPVALRDERLTSAAAHRTAREMEVRLRGRKGAIDRMSAVLILQGYLERRHA